VQFQRLRLTGFKSFVEPTELRIEPGLTAVVGPNGCGKSNLLEALRWVMGANSAKAMRAEGMDDVIFAGSGNRPARSRAEVLLQIDNSDRTAPARFNDQATLEVIRRIDELGAEDRTVLVDDVLVQLQELTDIVGDLAELARGDQQPAPREPLRLDLLVGDAVAVQNTHGRAKDVTFELTAEPCWVEGHADRLARAVGNLLDNARKWGPPGLPVSVDCRQGTVVVRDRGPGITPEDLPHIFDRFYRSPAARGLPGSGLGLAIVAQVVKAEGGTIVADNDPAGGARMTMALPVVAGPDEAPDLP